MVSDVGDANGDQNSHEHHAEANFDEDGDEHHDEENYYQDGDDDESEDEDVWDGDEAAGAPGGLEVDGVLHIVQVPDIDFDDADLDDDAAEDLVSPARRLRNALLLRPWTKIYGCVKALLQKYPAASLGLAQDLAPPLLTTPLIYALALQHPELLRLFLAFGEDEIGLNVPNVMHLTPLHHAAVLDDPECLEILLADPRIRIPSKVTRDGRHCVTLLWMTHYLGYPRSTEVLLASDFDLEYEDVSARIPSEAFARMRNPPQMLAEADTLIRLHLEKPQITRHLCRVKLERPAALAADLFALIVFLDEGLINLTAADDEAILLDGRDPCDAEYIQEILALTFFRLSRNLPLELQMVLCLRAFGSGRDIIRTADSEGAFLALADVLRTIDDRAQDLRHQDSIDSMDMSDSSSAIALSRHDSDEFWFDF